MEVPDETDTEISCAVRPETGRYGWTAAHFAFVVDPAKRDEKEERLWEAQRSARRVRLDAGGRRAADGGAAGGLEGVPAGAAGHAGERGGCVGGGGVAGGSLDVLLHDGYYGT